MKKIGVLYIATGKYTVFWKNFFETAERYFLNECHYEKNYFVFTDADGIDFEENDRVNRVYQESLPWPFITLNRFSIFLKANPTLEEMDYIYFFNANILFVSDVGEEILPRPGRPLVFIKHPGYYNKDKPQFPYEKNSKSTAKINDNEGLFYFMGGVNGGIGTDYLSMIKALKSNTDRDMENGVVALWHDESHLNRYAIDHSNEITILGPEYGYPEGWMLPFEMKIMIRDKSKHGGHSYLRNQKNKSTELFKEFLKWSLSKLRAD